MNDSPIFGPVRSRRLGISLGVNLMPATGKICNFDCIYCENGFNADRRTSDAFATLPTLREALEAKLVEMSSTGELPDVITLAGNGEPTASPVFPEVVDASIHLRDEYAPEARIAVLSNGTYADRPDVHRALLRVDDNLLKLDTVNPDYIRFVDQPAKGYDIEHQIEVFASFRGHVIIQSLFLTGTWQGHDVDNTGDTYVMPWLDALRRIGPRSVAVYTIARSTPAAGLRKATPQSLDSIAKRVRALGIDCSVSY